MRRFTPRIAALAASLACLAACGAPGASPSSIPFAAPSAGLRDAKSGTVYTCQSQSQLRCLVYQKGKIKKTLSSGLKKPMGIVAGADGLVYIADENAKAILVYSAGLTKKMQTLDDGGNAPVDVAVYKDEVLAANAKNATFFKKGASKPAATLVASGISKTTGVAFDPSGNCYASFATKSGAEVDEFKACKGKAQDLKISPGAPYGIAFDGSGNLYYATFSASTNGVYACSGVKSCKQVFNGFHIPQYVNFGPDFSDLWVTDLGTYSPGVAYLYEFDVANGKQLAVITDGLSFFAPPTGVAPGPGAL
ncbi:MAG TPA: hypothetical protein VHX17_05310 [Candidatus Cybelea sp.]|nr:hypothetical protein [Candidatus Cybelea sp.]